MEQSIALFTLKFDNPPIITLAKTVFRALPHSASKIKSNRELYYAFEEKPNEKNMEAFVRSCRVLLLYQGHYNNLHIKEEQNFTFFMNLIEDVKEIKILA